MTRFKVLGIDGDYTDCECCGRTGLKLTVVLGRLDADGTVAEVLRFGRDCAARATRLRRTGAAMQRAAEEAQRQADETRRRTPVRVGESAAVWAVEGMDYDEFGQLAYGWLCYASGAYHEVVAWAEATYRCWVIRVRPTR